MRRAHMLCYGMMAFMLGCQDTPPLFECEISYPDGEDSPPTLTCPRQKPVVLEDTLPAGATCVYEPEAGVILCDDESRFDATTGLRVVDTQEGVDLGGDSSMFIDMDNAPGGQGSMIPGASSQAALPSRLWGKSTCTPLQGRLLCANGARLDLANMSNVVEETCRAQNLPGFGARVVCAKEDGTLVAALPDGGNEEPECDTHQGVVQCEDGSTFDLESHRTAQGEMLEECLNPRLAPPAPPEVVARCLEELECDVPDDELLECYRTLVPSQACEEAMNPQLLCGDEPIEPEVQGIYCYAPNGVYWFSNQESVELFKEKGCSRIIGDVVVAPPQDEWEARGNAADRTDIRWLKAISNVQSIHGSLNILHTDLPLNRTVEYDEILADLGLAIVSYDLVWEDQVGIKNLLIPAELVHVGGQVRLADFKAVESLIFQKQIRRAPRFIGKDLAIQGNSFLMEMTLEEAEVGGSLVLAENTRLEGCELFEAIEWAYDYAGGLVLFQAITGIGKPPKNCLF